MKIFQVSLIKSYVVKIQAENSEKAKELSEFFTGDIYDISNELDKKEYNFEILEIEPTTNQVVEIEEIESE